MATHSTTFDGQECKLFEKKVTDSIGDLNANRHLYHFWVDKKNHSGKVAFGLTFNPMYSKQYSYLKDLTPELFSGMVEILLQFQQQQTATSQKASILNYHFGWKKVEPFHLKTLPHSLENFYSTVLYYVQDGTVAHTLTYATSICTEYDRFKTKMKFIIENIERSDVFHVLEYANDGRQYKFYISRRTHGIIAVNSIDMSKSEHPYQEVYYYARMLETCFEKAVGGVSIGVDHSRKTIWLWADCDEKRFETQVLTPHQTTATGEFQQYSVKPPNCKAVFVNPLPCNIDEGMLRDFFHECGEIHHINIPRGRNFAFVYFVDTEAVDKAVELNQKMLLDRKKVLVDFCRRTDDSYTGRRLRS